jgi:hypothetical protein
MKVSLLVLALFATLGPASFAAMELKDIDKDQVVEQLEKSKTVFASSLEAVRAYAKSYQYEETSRTIQPYIHYNNVQPGIFILYLNYGPKNPPVQGTYPVIYVEAYFRTPTNFDQVFGRTDFDFYRLDTIVNSVTIGPKQPGDISSAGGGRK